MGKLWVVIGLAVFGLAVGLSLGELSAVAETSNLAAFGVLGGLGLGAAVAAFVRD